MHDAENPILLNSDNVFFDSKDIFYEDIKNISTTSLDVKNVWLSEVVEGNNRILNLKNYNYLEERTLNIAFFIGFGSTYSNNQILNSQVYKKDKSYSEGYVYKPFRETEENKGNDIVSLNNTLIFKKTYGLQNPDPIFEKIDSEPFEEIDRIESGRELLSMPNEIKYPKYFNQYALAKLNSNISIFGTIEEIDGTNLTEKSLRGIICEIVSKGKDSRGRSVSFSEKTSLRERSIDPVTGKPIFSLEPYTDEEYTDIVTKNDGLLERSFKYVNKIINGSVYTVLDASEGSSSVVSTISNKIIFYTEDNNNILPFNDRWSLDEIRRIKEGMPIVTNNNSDSWPSHGNDNNNSTRGTSAPDSIAFSRGQD